jgi:fatty acid desaturase
MSEEEQLEVPAGLPNLRIEAAPALPEGVSWRGLMEEWTRRVSEAGLLQPDPLYYLLWSGAVVGAYVAAFAGLLAEPHWALRVGLCALLAFCAVQCGLLGHEAWHGAITRRRGAQRALGLLFCNLLSGHSGQRWNQAHNEHHRACNEEGRDPDLAVELFALDPVAAAEKSGLARWTTRHQALLVPILVGMQGFSMMRDTFSWYREPRPGRWIELGLTLTHLCLWIALPAALIGWGPALLHYGLRTLLTGHYMSAIFIVNHVGQGTIGLGESVPFFWRQLRTTRNIRGGWLLSRLMGGLNHQIEHHLGPTMSSRRAAQAVPITRELCQRYGLPYVEQGWMEALGEVRAHLALLGRGAPAGAAR